MCDSATVNRSTQPIHRHIQQIYARAFIHTYIHTNVHTWFSRSGVGANLLSSKKGVSQRSSWSRSSSMAARVVASLSGCPVLKNACPCMYVYVHIWLCEYMYMWIHVCARACGRVLMRWCEHIPNVHIHWSSSLTHKTHIHININATIHTDNSSNNTALIYWHICTTQLRTHIHI